MRFPAIYSYLLHKLMNSELQETNERTGSRLKILPSGCSFILDLSDDVLPTMGVRRAFPYVAGAELAWFLSGECEVDWLNDYAPRIWSKFVEDGTNIVANAYGWRWRAHFHRDQIADAVAALRANPSDRRVYVGAWDPAQDGLGKPSKNVPCPVGFSIYVVGGSVHLSVFLRSLDTFVGLPYDVMDFALLLKAFAVELGLQPGTLRTTAAHVHLYEKHWEMAEEAVGQMVMEPIFKMPDIGVLDIALQRDTYVKDLRTRAKLHVWPEYNPKPEVIE